MTDGRYLTVAELKDYVNSALVTKDALYLDAILFTENEIDKALGRKIVLADTVATARLFTPPRRSSVLNINDCTEITAVVDYGATLTTTSQYMPLPLNGIDDAGEAWPYEALQRLSGGYSMSWINYGKPGTVSVTAKWGWPAIPSMVKGACRIIAKDVLLQGEVKFGLVGGIGFAGGGGGTQENKLVQDTITRYRSAKSWAIA